MANILHRPKDPTEEALNAIEEALATRSPAPSISLSAADRDHNAAAVDDLFNDGEATAPWTAAANDDRVNVGHILQTLRRRPARTPLVIATIAALAWTALALGTAYLYNAELHALLTTPRLAVVVALTLAGCLIVPIVFFYMLGHLFSRAHDMRIVAESMAEVAMRFGQPETAAREAIVTVGQAIRREVTAMGDGVERALARAAELEALVHNEVSALERAYNDNEVRIRDLLNELSNQRETLVNQAEQVRNAIASVHLDLSHDITSVGDLVSDKVAEVAQRVARTLTEKGEHITLALGHAGDSMIDTLSERGSTLLDRLENTSDRATTAIASASDRLSESLKFKTDNIHDEFAELSSRLQQMMATRLDHVAHGFAQKSSTIIDEMADHSQAIITSFNNSATEIAGTIVARGAEMNADLRSTGDSLVQNLNLRGTDVVSRIEQTGARIADTIIGRSEAVIDTFRDKSELLVQTVNDRGDAVREMLNIRLKAFEDIFNHGGTELTEKISRDTTTLGDLITSHVAKFDHTVKTYGGDLVERLGTRTQEISDAMRAYIDGFDARVTSHNDELGGSLDQRLARFEEMLGARVTDLAKTLNDGGKELVQALDHRVEETATTINNRATEAAETIGAKAEEIDRTLGERALQVANTLDSRVSRFEDLLLGRAESVTAEIENRTRAAADAVHARMEQLSHTIKTNSAEAEHALGQLASSASDAIRSSSSEAERALRNVSDEVARDFVGRANEIANAVAQRAQMLETVLSEKTGGVLATLAEKGQQFAGDITQASEQAVSLIENKGFTFTRSMLENSAEMSRLISVAGENAANSVTRTLVDLQDATQKAITQSKDVAAAAVTEMVEAHNMLRSDSTVLFERLREASIMLQEVLSGSHENMSTLENTLMLRVSEFVAAMAEVNASTGDATSRVEANIGNFREVTDQLLRGLGQISSQFDTHGQELARSAELIEQSNRNTDEAINHRHAQLESLVSSVDIRTEDLEQRLKHFSGLLDQSLEAASSRARDVVIAVSEASEQGARTLNEEYQRVREQAEELARLVSQSGAESAREITEQFNRVREHADAERRRVSGAMHDIFEQSAGDTQTVFRDATERFAATIHDMKKMAGEMQRELEATRAELRRGVLELPQEASESTAQMRRVIVDQIEALAELNRIVARHGRNLDVAEPARRSREEPSPSIAGGREPTPRAELGTRGETSTRAPARNGDTGGFGPSPRRPAPESGVSAPAAAQQTPGRGWLTDLLNRASREEPEAARDYQRDTREPPRGADERSPRHSIESLDSLSVDIARMIDHDAAADLWDRYKRGERNVFTRRLYTLQGQQAFDEIRKKYRADREFKQTVDRYIDEFERLLDEVSRDDRGQVVARTYLTSETGKVYTMLAHASGRFD